MKHLKTILCAALVLCLLSLCALAEDFSASTFAADLETTLRETYGDALNLFYDAETSTFFVELPADAELYAAAASDKDAWNEYTEALNIFCTETRDAMNEAGYTDTSISLSLYAPEDDTTVVYCCVDGFDVFNIAP